MQNRKDPLHTLQAAVEILRFIPKRGSISTQELVHKLAAAGLPRTERAVQRWLRALCDSGLHDIEREDGSKPYRYRWKENAKGFSVGGLNAQECLLLTLAEQQLGALLPAKLMKSMDGFFAQARSQLDDKGATQRERQWLEKVRVVSTSQPLLPPKVDPDAFEQVSNALYGNQWLDVDYKNAGGKRAISRVMPLGLAQQGPRMYLVCRFEGYDNERCLALHRVVSAKASTLTFDRPKEFNLKKFDEAGRFGYGTGDKIQLSFKIEKDAGLHVVECPLSSDQKVVELDGVYEISASVLDSAMLDWWLRGFGDAVSEIRKRTESI